MNENLWFTLSAVLNVTLLLMYFFARAVWKECGRQWKKDTSRMYKLESYFEMKVKRGDMSKMFAMDYIPKETVERWLKESEPEGE